MLKDTSDRWQKWKTRFLSMVLMVALFAGVLWLGHLALIVLVLAIQTRCFFEILNIRVLKHRHERQTSADAASIIPFYKLLDVWFFAVTLYAVNGRTIFSSFSLFFASGLPHWFLHNHAFISFTLYTIGFVTFVLTLEKGKYRRQFQQLSWTVVTMIGVVYAGSFHVLNITRGLFWFLFPCFLVVCNDTWAFVWGFHFGKTSLIGVSPRKTWEGFIGAFFSTIIMGFFAAGFMAKSYFLICPRSDLLSFAATCDIDPVFELAEYTLPSALVSLGASLGLPATVHLYPVQLHSVALSIFASLIAPFGGFFASGFKRAFKIKDFADTIPGHGGITDRVDCQFVMGAFAAIYYATFVASVPLGLTATITNMITILPETEQRKIYQWLGTHLQSLHQAQN